MPRPVSVSELETHCLRIVEEVSRGRREVVITKRGKRVADAAAPRHPRLGLVDHAAREAFAQAAHRHRTNALRCA